jgi:hypothetical protein
MKLQWLPRECTTQAQTIGVFLVGGASSSKLCQFVWHHRIQNSSVTNLFTMKLFKVDFALFTIHACFSLFLILQALPEHVNQEVEAPPLIKHSREKIQVFTGRGLVNSNEIQQCAARRTPW